MESRVVRVVTGRRLNEDPGVSTEGLKWQEKVGSVGKGKEGERGIASGRD